jgi:hypothetical protein
MLGLFYFSYTLVSHLAYRLLALALNNMTSL